MIRYQYKNAKLLFVGINPHYGSFENRIPFSNNKLFWYLLLRAGLIEESMKDLRNITALKKIYETKFNRVYRLGLVNIINRPTRDITELKKGEENKGVLKIRRIISSQKPNVVCFIGKVSYEKYTGLKNFTFGWQNDIRGIKTYVMHAPLRGEADVRVEELKLVAGVADLLR